jgi:hypothetical protein
MQNTQRIKAWEISLYSISEKLRSTISHAFYHDLCRVLSDNQRIMWLQGPWPLFNYVRIVWPQNISDSAMSMLVSKLRGCLVGRHHRPHCSDLQWRLPHPLKCYLVAHSSLARHTSFYSFSVGILATCVAEEFAATYSGAATDFGVWRGSLRPEPNRP